MANNRMYLRHKPSGAVVLLGKTWGLGWRVFDGTEARLNAFFGPLPDDGEGDAASFELIFESDTTLGARAWRDRFRWALAKLIRP